MTVTDNHITHFDKNNPHLYVKILPQAALRSKMTMRITEDKQSRNNAVFVCVWYLFTLH